MDGVRIPTLPSLLERLRAATPRRELYVEIKTSPQAPAESSDYEALTRAVVRDLDAADYGAHARVIAFDWRVIRLLRTLKPSLKTSHLTIPATLQQEIVRDANGESPWADGCDPCRHGDSEPSAIAAHGGKCWSAYFSEISPEKVAEARRIGLAVAAWGVVKRADIRAVTDLGVDSITVAGPHWSA